MKPSAIVSIASICVLCIVGCGKKQPTAWVTNVSGTAIVTRGDQRLQKEPDRSLPLMPGDVISAADSSNAQLLFGERDTIHLSQNTAVRLIESPADNNTSRLTLGLLFGRAYLTCRLSETLICSLITPNASVSAHQARITVEYYPKAGITIAKALTGDKVRIYTNSGNTRSIRSCRKVLARKDGRLSRTVSLSDNDITELEQWVGKEVIDPLLAGTGCGAIKTNAINKPPVFVGDPRRTAPVDAPFSDKLTAIDPESAQVTYQLLGAPQGMTIDSQSGLLSFTPRDPGTFPIQVRAEDSQMNSVDIKYELTVTGLVTAVLQLPRVVSPGDTFDLSAYRSVNELGTREGLLYRFDTDGDGSWDSPKTGAFGKRASAYAVFAREGEKKLSVQVRSSGGKSSRATRTVRINAPPKAAVAYTPSAGTPGTQFSLDASRSADPSGDSLKIRWDLNGDGIWDYPESGDYGTQFTVDHMWEHPGVYAVTVEVRDAWGLTDSATVRVTLYEGIRIANLQMPDTVAVNDSFSLSCITAGDSAVKPTKFSWSLDGDSLYEVSSTTNRLKHLYEKSGTYEIWCMVSDDKGGEAVTTRELVVVNQKAVVDAGGPYKAFVNDTVSLSGSGSDPDNTVSAFLWDLDNDGQVDHSDAHSTELKRVFARKGSFTVGFGMKTNDGVIVWDEARVIISNRPPEAKAGEPIVSRAGKKVSLNGIGSDPDGNIAEYRWDFDGDGSWDWESSESGAVTHAFKEYSTAIFGVIDGDGAESRDSVRVVICPDDMRTIEDGAYCIDRYEWPNKKNREPQRNVSWQKAKEQCESVGKRLCAADEWRHACTGGKEKNTYPYGKHFEPLKCNTLGNKKVDNRAAKTGLFLECVNRYGLHDMSGNVAEWTSDGSGAVRHVYGGWWQDDQQRTHCESFIPLESGKDYLHVGFRCCK